MKNIGETDINRYVLGFLFNEDLTKVLLIRKQRPEWQRNLHNGVGGKVKEGETLLGAMIRECREETGIEVSDWYRHGSLWTPNGLCAIFAATTDINRAKTMTDEAVVIQSINDMILVIPGLHLLIPEIAKAVSKNRNLRIIEVTSCAVCPYFEHHDGGGHCASFWKCGKFNIMLIDQDGPVFHDISTVHPDCRLERPVHLI